MSPLSSDPRRRERQLANLRRGGQPAPPPPPSGNRRRVTHGAFAAVTAATVDAKVAQLADALAEDATVATVAHTVVFRLLAQCLLRSEAVGAYLAMHGQLDAKGNERPASVIETRLRREALDLCREMGLTQRSEAALGLDHVRAYDLANAMSALDTDDGDVVDGTVADA